LKLVWALDFQARESSTSMVPTKFKVEILLLLLRKVRELEYFIHFTFDPN